MRSLVDGVARSWHSPVSGRAGRRKHPASRFHIGHMSAFNPLGIPFDLGVGRGRERDRAGNHAWRRPARTSTSTTSGTRAPISSFATIRARSCCAASRSGLSGGLLRYSDIRGVETIASRSTRRPSASIVDYNWMLGAQRRFLVGTGVGAKRILASSEERNRVGSIERNSRTFHIGDRVLRVEGGRGTGTVTDSVVRSPDPVPHPHPLASRRNARVAELADAPDLGSGAERLGGSSPPFAFRLSFSFNPRWLHASNCADWFRWLPSLLRERSSRISRLLATDPNVVGTFSLTNSNGRVPPIIASTHGRGRVGHDVRSARHSRRI